MAEKGVQIRTERLRFSTKGAGDLVDLTAELAKLLARTKLQEGSLTVFGVGSTLGIVTFEYEPGLIRDMKELYERLAPSDRSYAHDQTWGDANGFSHLRAALQGQSLAIPFEGGRLLLGTWQQVVAAEFDNKPRRREVVVQLMGRPAS
ncbi:MAG: secondary thiamine-phosphate synthase enzyme YjbQ [Elusimicrobia bacterium]|jgi:secondary thiamine-phosphate synthase enzyme|nr:secondary thiamine-phosphate synthase enzyme YjbQ [Elusimicrobiota bacterium]